MELSPRLRLGLGQGYSQNQKLKVITILFLVLAVALGLNAVRLVFRNTSFSGDSAEKVLGATDAKDAFSEIEFLEYKVQKGDTLFNISQRYNINWSTLATLNNLRSPFTLKVGQIVKIPK